LKKQDKNGFESPVLNIFLLGLKQTNMTKFHRKIFLLKDQIVTYY